jgi:SAM-dependent methyltransferase
MKLLCWTGILIFVQSPPRFYRVDQIVERFATRGPILDVGCGDGRMVARLRAAGHECVGVDINPDILSVAQQTYGGGQWIQGDGQALPFGSESFSTVISLYFAANLMDRDRFLAEAERVLAPGGRIVYTLVNPQVRAFEAAQARLRMGRSVDLAGLKAHMKRLGAPTLEWKRLHRHGLAPEPLVGPMWMPLIRRNASWLRRAPILSGKAVGVTSDVVVRAHKPSGLSDARLTGTENELVQWLGAHDTNTVADWLAVRKASFVPGTYLVATRKGLLRARWQRKVALWPRDAHWFQPESGSPFVVWPDAVIARSCVSGVV